MRDEKMAVLWGLLAFMFAVRGGVGQVPISFDEDRNRPRHRNDPCVGTNGGRPVDGVCLPMQDCQIAIESYTSVGVPLLTTCGFEGVTRIVCCVEGGPKNSSPGRNVTTSQNVVDISSPDLDFVCGQRPPIKPSEREKRSVPGNGTISKNGVSDNETFSTATAQAVGGFTSQANSWPWTALFGWSTPDGATRWRSGGTLINRRWVLTAAHCFDQGDPQVVRLGEHDYSHANGPFRQDFKIRRYLLYPEYDTSAAYHDLALVELDMPVDLKPEVSPVCLSWGIESLANMSGRTVTITGWGATQHGGQLSPVLQEVSLAVFPPRLCDTRYRVLPAFDLEFPRGIQAMDFVCAGDVAGGKDACNGDSGSPITYPSFDQDYVLAGVVSKGYGCGLVDFPGLYTPLHKGEYLNWIKTTAFE